MLRRWMVFWGVVLWAGRPIIAGDREERILLTEIVQETNEWIETKAVDWFQKDLLKDPTIMLSLHRLQNKNKPHLRRWICRAALKFTDYKKRSYRIGEWDVSQWLVDESWQPERLRDRLMEQVLFASKKSVASILDRHPEWQADSYQRLPIRDYLAPLRPSLMQLAKELESREPPIFYLSATILFFEKLAQLTGMPIGYTDLSPTEDSRFVSVELLIKTHFQSFWEFRIRLPASEDRRIQLLFTELIDALNEQATYNPSKRKLLGFPALCQKKWE